MVRPKRLPFCVPYLGECGRVFADGFGHSRRRCPDQNLTASVPSVDFVVSFPIRARRLSHCSHPGAPTPLHFLLVKPTFSGTYLRARPNLQAVKSGRARTCTDSRSRWWLQWGKTPPQGFSRPEELEQESTSPSFGPRRHGFPDKFFSLVRVQNRARKGTRRWPYSVSEMPQSWT